MAFTHVPNAHALLLASLHQSGPSDQSHRMRRQKTPSRPSDEVLAADAAGGPAFLQPAAHEAGNQAAVATVASGSAVSVVSTKIKASGTAVKKAAASSAVVLSSVTSAPSLTASTTSMASLSASSSMDPNSSMTSATSADATASSSSQPTSHTALSTPAIIAIAVVASLVGLGILFALGSCLLRRRRAKQINTHSIAPHSEARHSRLGGVFGVMSSKPQRPMRPSAYMRNNSNYDEKFDTMSFDDDARPLADANGVGYSHSERGSPTIVNSPSGDYHEKTYLDESSPTKGSAKSVMGPSEVHERYLEEAGIYNNGMPHQSQQADHYDSYAAQTLPKSASQRQIYPMTTLPPQPERSLQDLHNVLGPPQVHGEPEEHMAADRPDEFSAASAGSRISPPGRPSSLTIANPDLRKPPQASSTPAMGGDLYRHSLASTAITQDSFYPYSSAQTASHPSLEGSNFEFDRLNSASIPMVPPLPQPKGILKPQPSVSESRLAAPLADIPERPNSEGRELAGNPSTMQSSIPNQPYLTYQQGPMSQGAGFVAMGTDPRHEPFQQGDRPSQQAASIRTSPPRVQQNAQNQLYPMAPTAPSLVRKVSFKPDHVAPSTQQQAPVRPQRPDAAHLVPPMHDSSNRAPSAASASSLNVAPQAPYRSATLSMFGMYDDDETGPVTYADATSELR